MKKTDKTKKKAGKKKNAKNTGGFEFDTKQLQKEFNKRMKVLVDEVKKETQQTIKVLMKEAKERLQASSEFVRNDVLKSIITQYETLTAPEYEEAPAASPTRTTGTAATRATTRKRTAAASTGTARATSTRAGKTAGTAKPAGTTKTAGTATRGRKAAPQPVNGEENGQEAGR
ncbi:MAG: hypothetical protein ACO1NZ_18340 [Adhaeribacter sp.]